MIETKIQWNKPEDIAPPFDKEILVLVGGQEYRDGVWMKYLKPFEVKIRKQSYSDGEYKEFIAGKLTFSECEFCLNEMNPVEDFDISWSSDSIVLWAESPLSELNKLLEASE